MKKSEHEQKRASGVVFRIAQTDAKERLVATTCRSHSIGEWPAVMTLRVGVTWKT